MANTISPNMNLVIPGVGTEAGPTYAQDVNASLTLIDQHDHSIGEGVQITPAGMNINVNLPFNSNSAISLLNAVFVTQSTATTTLQALSVAPGSESPAIQDLWYTDSAGNKVQITSGGELAPVTASVEGITYASGTFSFKDTQSFLPTTPANLDAGSITIHPTTALTTQGVQLNLPSGLPPSVYDLQLPLIPANISFLTIDTSGNISGTVSETQGITRNMLATGAVAANDTNTVTGSYAALTTDDYIETSGTTTVTLYAVTGASIGRRLTIKKTDNTLLVTTITSSSLSTTLNTIGESVDLIINGAGNWVVINRTIPENENIYTPTFTAFGAPTLTNVQSFRRGSYLLTKGVITTGTTTVTTPTMTIGFDGMSTPSGLAINTAQLGSNNVIIGTYASNGNGQVGSMLYQAGNTTTVAFAFNYSSNVSQIAANNNGAAVSPSGGFLSFYFEVPITGWNG
jgi:hypothetical protein